MPKLGRAPKHQIIIPETDRVVATAMAAGAGYNTGAVIWPVGRGRRRKRSPNRATIRARQSRLRRWLRKHGRTHPDLAAVGAIIARCGRVFQHHRCGHPACPRCAYALQSLLVRTVRRSLAQRPEEAWMIVSVVLPPREASGDIDFAAEQDRYAALLTQAGITHGIFGLDLSFNEDHRRAITEAERFEPHASVHLFGFAPAAEVRAAEAKLKHWVPATEASPRPVWTDDFDGRLSGIAYAFKPDFERRQTVEQFDRRRGKLGRNTRHRPRLLVEQEIRAVRALARAGLTGRIILLGLRFETTKTGRVCLVPTT